MLGWAYYETITVADGNVDGDLADFPLLVAFDADADMGAHARSDGYDIRFTLDDGQAELGFERESFAVSNGKATGRFWVRVPSILATGGAVIRCYYGNPDAADASDPENVWTNDFACVFHFAAGDPANEYDAVDTSRKLTPINSPIWHSDGPGGAACYEFGNAAERAFWTKGWTPASGSPLTLEAFVRPTSADISNWRSFLVLREAADYHALGTATSNRLRALSYTSGSGSPAAYATVTADQWCHVAGTFTGTAFREIFIDGAPIASDTTDVGAMNDATYLLVGARTTSGSPAIDGRLAEVRVSTVIRSDAWIKFTHANIANTGNELSWGVEMPTGVIHADVSSRRRYEALIEARVRRLALVRAK